MKVEIVAYTPSPVDTLSTVAGMSYGKTNVREKRLESCVRNKHLSVLEHATITFRITGVSRALTHQLVRHRHTSFTQLSQRYVKMDTEGTDWYAKPVGITEVDDEGRAETIDALYDRCMATCSLVYRGLLANGVKPEDARYVLPEATHTAITMTMNYRELFHFLKLRLSSSAQDEIRKLARKVLKKLSESNDEQLRTMATLYDTAYNGEE